MYNHNKAQQSKNRVHISWDILYMASLLEEIAQGDCSLPLTLNPIKRSLY